MCWSKGMPWNEDGHYSVCHERMPWDSRTPTHVLVHTELSRLYGTHASFGDQRDEREALYEQAKHDLDADAAWAIVREAISEEIIDQLADQIDRLNPADRLFIVIPHPAFEEGVAERQDPALGPTNAIPIIFGHYLAERLACEVDNEITQIARVGRTNLNRFQRFLWQPCFEGDVQPGTHYIIVDDVVTLGASFAALRSHIVRQGGSVCAVTALAHKDGRNQQFPITSGTIEAVRTLYGSRIDPFWQEAIGHDVEALTEAEGLFLRQWGRDCLSAGTGAGEPLLYRLRDRLDQAAAGKG